MIKLDKIYEIAEKIKNGEREFSIKPSNFEDCDGRIIDIISAKRGNAICYYAVKNILEDEVYSIGYHAGTYEMFAIYVNGYIYISNLFSIDFWGNIKKDEKDALLEKGIILFDDFSNDLDKMFMEVAYPRYYDSFVPTKITKDYVITDERISEKMWLDEARNIILHGFVDKERNNIDGLSKNRILKMLCLGQDHNSVFQEALEKQKEKIDMIKSRNEYIDYAIKTGKAAEKWEIRLADAINNVDAKTVNVEFEFNGKTAETKIECDRLIYNLVRKNYFSSYNFQNEKLGKQLLQSIGADNYLNHDRNIYAQNIKSVSFRGKKIYER